MPRPKLAVKSFFPPVKGTRNAAGSIIGGEHVGLSIQGEFATRNTIRESAHRHASIAPTTRYSPLAHRPDAVGSATSNPAIVLLDSLRVRAPPSLAVTIWSVQPRQVRRGPFNRNAHAAAPAPWRSKQHLGK